MTIRSATLSKEWPAQSIPATAGIGLRSEHYQEVLNRKPEVGWLEVHSENFFGEGGVPHYYLSEIRSHYPISFHGVGLSLGSVDELSKEHLKKLKTIIQRYQPGLVSEHLSWSSVDGQFFNDLLPLPYTEESLTLLSDRICETQNYLGREILIENPSTYLEFQHSTIPETEFIDAVTRKSGCGLLLDINNVFVCASNHGFDALTYLQEIPIDIVREIHLAGHTVNEFDDGRILIDTHNQRVCKEVWGLYAAAVNRFGRVPTLIEWDTDLPMLDVLIEEAGIAQNTINNYTITNQKGITHARVA